MKILAILLLSVLGTLPRAAESSANIVLPWDKVDITAYGIGVRAELGKDQMNFRSLSVKPGKHWIAVPNAELARIPNPRLYTLRIQNNCGSLAQEVEPWLKSGQCVTYISLDFDDSENGRTYGEQCPRAVLVFSDHAFQRVQLEPIASDT